MVARVVVHTVMAEMAEMAAKAHSLLAQTWLAMALLFTVGLAVQVGMVMAAVVEMVAMVVRASQEPPPSAMHRAFMAVPVAVVVIVSTVLGVLVGVEAPVLTTRARAQS
jgi:hypothetical protein